jgi:4F5 protein related disordered region
MTRGNQRELAREKNLKKQRDQKKVSHVPDGMNFRQKQEM